MKALVVYYSHEGNTKMIANTIAKELGADTIELKPKKEIPNKGFMKYLWGGKSVIFREEPILLNDLKDVEKYDFIIIGTPIWAGKYSSPIRTFINQGKLKDKKIALFACHAGGGAEKCFAEFKKELPGNTIIGEIDFVDPLKGDKERNEMKARDWAKELKKK